MRLMEAVAGGMIEDHRRAVESYARFRLQTPVTEPSPGTLEVTCFAKPDNVTNTVVYRHGDSAFPIHRKENFAARTTLKPNTEYIIEHRSVMGDSTGALTENTVEKYYTDDTGTVTRVDTYAGVKGAWPPRTEQTHAQRHLQRHRPSRRRTTEHVHAYHGRFRKAKIHWGTYHWNPQG
ncbi:hypothetical protein ARUE_c09100 [Arthrobacter sp. Rue61a]|nr:hypothetical protein ARUE_c09100 [Arthrobacter sp. Rue61a]